MAGNLAQVLNLRLLASEIIKTQEKSSFQHIAGYYLRGLIVIRKIHENKTTKKTVILYVNNHKLAK